MYNSSIAKVHALSRGLAETDRLLILLFCIDWKSRSTQKRHQVIICHVPKRALVDRKHDHVHSEEYPLTRKVLLIKAVSLLAAIITGFFFNAIFVSEGATRIGINTSIISGFLFWAISASSIYILVQLVVFRKLYVIERRILLVAYLLTVIAGLFLRSAHARRISLNPISFISDFRNDSSTICIHLINLCLFIPLKPLLHWNKWKVSVFFVVLGFLLLEVLQHFSGRGFADVGDIVLYLTGYGIGALILYFVCGRKKKETV